MREIDKELLKAAKFGDKDKIKELLEKGADVNARDNEYGYTGLIYTAKRGDLEMGKLLIEK